MAKSRTSKTRRHSRSQILEVRVMSPRIAWFGFLKFAGSLGKIACILAVIAGLGWGAWLGVKRAFYQNPDFSLRIIDLNPNPVIDELGLAEAAGIDLNANLFEIDVAKVTAKLQALPGISAAHVERHLPGKLVVRVTPRTPKAWISCADAGLSEARQVGSLLVDRQGIAYPCPERQLETAKNLPVIELPRSETCPIVAGEAVPHAELKHCFRLLDSASEADSEAVHWIESVKQVNEWSLLLVTRGGVSATFALGDHSRQISNLRAAMANSTEKGYAINTINLIPKHNVPITLRSETAAPRAVPVTPPSAGKNREDRRSRDLNTLLNRN
jgi:hypothetical protein